MRMGRSTLRNLRDLELFGEELTLAGARGMKLQPPSSSCRAGMRRHASATLGPVGILNRLPRQAGTARAAARRMSASGIESLRVPRPVSPRKSGDSAGRARGINRAIGFRQQTTSGRSHDRGASAGGGCGPHGWAAICVSCCVARNSGGNGKWTFSSTSSRS